jgi:hypothetical protein
MVWGFHNCENSYFGLFRYCTVISGIHTPTFRRDKLFLFSTLKIEAVDVLLESEYLPTRQHSFSLHNTVIRILPAMRRWTQQPARSVMTACASRPFPERRACLQEQGVAVNEGCLRFQFCSDFTEVTSLKQPFYAFTGCPTNSLAMLLLLNSFVCTMPRLKQELGLSYCLIAIPGPTRPKSQTSNVAMMTFQ